MGEVVGDIPPDQRESIYPWDKWFDGQVWKLTQGEDFTITPAGFRALAVKTAQRRNIAATVALRGSSVFIQASEGETA